MEQGHGKQPWEKEKKLHAYLDRMLYDGIPAKDNVDPINYHRQAHDTSIMELKDQLTKAVGEKREEALPIAIKIFNRIQEKAVKTTRLSLKTEDENDSQMSNINDEISKIDILLNDPSSPLISNLRASSKYATQKLPETIE